MNDPPVDHDNPEWTEEDFARAKAGRDVLPRAFLQSFRRKPGRPAGSSKQQVTLRLDRDILERFKAGGPGWQTRINDALRRAKG